LPQVLCLVEATNPIAAEANKRIPDGWDLVIADGTSKSKHLENTISSADFLLLANSAALTNDLLRLGTNVRLIQLTSAGYDGVNLLLSGELGIPVANNGGANAIPVAEFAITLMLATLRHLIVLDRETRAGRWMPDWASGDNSYELSGKTVGIVGAGRIGSTVAKLLRGFEPVLRYADPLQSKIGESYGAKHVTLDSLLSESDIVTVHVPLVPSTRALIGTREIALMKHSAVLINSSRGPVVDEAALIESLRLGKIWGAGIDVFEQEPVDPQNPLLKMENCVIAPHVAGKSQESMPRRVQFAMDNMQRVWKGLSPESIVQAD